MRNINKQFHIFLYKIIEKSHQILFLILIAMVHISTSIILWDQSPVKNNTDLKTDPGIHQNIESYQRDEGKLKQKTWNMGIGKSIYIHSDKYD